MKLTDEQMVEVLKEAGHAEAATALEQKLTAQAAVAAPDNREVNAALRGAAGSRVAVSAAGDQANKSMNAWLRGRGQVVEGDAGDEGSS